MVIIGCTPPGRFTEQHDVFFGIGKTLRELIPQMKDFWKEANEKIHIDAWRQVSVVDEYFVIIDDKKVIEPVTEKVKLFFINLGGYKENEFEEYHYKIVCAAADKGEAVRKSRQTAFYKHYGFEGAESHVDDKYGIDVDDLYQIEDIIPDVIKTQYAISLVPANNAPNDELHIGYVTMEKLQKSDF